MKYERRHHPLLPRRKFVARLARNISLAAALIGGALVVGTLGYRLLAGFDWIDAILNASMILTGMGPVNPLPNDSSKLFASGYALFSGVVFLMSVGVILAPIVHRFLHHFHLDDEPAGR